MANIRVTCPMCTAELEVDEQHAGQEVECGTCFQVFRAKGPKGKPGITGYKPAAARKRREDDDDDDDYEHDRRRRRRDDDDDDDLRDDRPTGATGVGLGVTSVVLGGIAVLTFCAFFLSVPLGVAAILLGQKAARAPMGGSLGWIGGVLGSLAIIGCILFWLWLIGVRGGQFN